MTGWWLLLTPLKNDGVKVTWDDDIPKCFWKVRIHSMVPKKNNHFNDLSGDVDDVDVRFPEGKHGKHPNIINSTMKSRFPKWKGMPWMPTGAHRSPPGLGPPLPLFTFPGVLAKSPRKIQEFSNESRELWLTEMNIQVLWLES